MEQINTALNQAEIELIDGALESYFYGFYWGYETEREIHKLRIKLNQSLTCEAPECNRHRVGMDQHCDQCEVFPMEHAQLCSSR